MEIFKDLSSKASQEFEKLLNSQLSKINIEEGKVIDGKINKITEKFVFLFVEGLKSEPVLDINELKSMGFYHHATTSRLNRQMGRIGAFGSETVAIYTGAIRLKGTYFGVKKQHTFILRDTPIIMDGYEVKGLEKIQ